MGDTLSTNTAQQPLYDSVVLAGDGEAHKPVYGHNKALLDLGGRPLLAHVIDALRACRYISRIFIVGPRNRILESLEEARVPLEGDKEVIVLEQRTNVLENSDMGYLATLPTTVDQDGKALPPEILKERYGEKPVLFLSSDLPILTPYELEEFIEKSDLSRYDYTMGMTPEAVLEAYHPTEGMPGIIMAPFCLRETKVRQNNLHLARWLRIENRHYGQLMYQNRHQRRWRSILNLLWTVLPLPEITVGIVFRFLMLHLSLGLNRWKWLRPLQRLVQWFTPLEKLEGDVSRLMKTRFATVTTSYGGAALDVDSEEHLEALREQYARWLAHQKQIHGKRTKP